jgi:hypothetical protein
VFSLMAALAVAAIGPALAGNPHGGGGAKGGGPSGSSGTIALHLLESTDGMAHYGQHVTFDLVTSDPQPWVELDCFVGGANVYQDRRGFFESSLSDDVFVLGTTRAWQSGEADCTASLIKYN